MDLAGEPAGALRLDGEPERAIGRANPLVQAEQGKVRDPRARNQGTGEMERIEGPDGVASGEGARGLSSDEDSVTVSMERR